MSRAFVKESDGELPELPPRAQEIPLPEGARNYMTPAGAQRLREELDRLQQRELPALLRLLQEARGTDSTGAARELASLRGRLKELEYRVDFLTRRLQVTEVIDPATQAQDCVRFGATVVVADATGAERTYRIVGIDETDAKRGDISWLSPMARALINSRVGDSVRLKLPRGEQELEVLAIRYG